MKIAEVRVVRLEGAMEHEGVFWEERLIRPLDIYPEHKADRGDGPRQLSAKEVQIVAHFVEIESDEGIVGIGGPIPEEQAYIIEKSLKPLLLGHDPLAIERLWDRMYRFSVHGRKGVNMMAMSAVDCALWDLKG
ncbi:MAG: mandelate racemase/muconate lactonizing protein, partial [Caldilineaceae bacterium]